MKSRPPDLLFVLMDMRMMWAIAKKTCKKFGGKGEFLYLCSGINEEETIAATKLNDAQLELLKMMSVFNTPDVVSELKQAVSDFFAQKASEEIDRLWADGTLTEEKVEGFRMLHERTPYKN